MIANLSFASARSGTATNVDDLGALNKALQKQAVDRAPEDGSLRMNLAKLYLQSEQKGMARSELEKLERMGRKYPNQDEVGKMLKAL